MNLNCHLQFRWLSNIYISISTDPVHSVRENNVLTHVHVNIFTGGGKVSLQRDPTLASPSLLFPSLQSWWFNSLNRVTLPPFGQRKTLEEGLMEGLPTIPTTSFPGSSSLAWPANLGWGTVVSIVVLFPSAMIRISVWLLWHWWKLSYLPCLPSNRIICRNSLNLSPLPVFKSSSVALRLNLDIARLAYLFRNMPSKGSRLKNLSFHADKSLEIKRKRKLMGVKHWASIMHTYSTVFLSSFFSLNRLIAKFQSIKILRQYKIKEFQGKFLFIRAALSLLFLCRKKGFSYALK